MRDILTCLFISIIMFALSVQSISAQRDKKQSKRPSKMPVAIAPAEPDQMAHHSSADTPLRDVDIRYIKTNNDSNGPHGIDVSHYQGSINWNQVANNDHAAYVYIKATEGANNVDDMYQINFRGAKRAGIPVGSYHFFRANVSPQVQLRNFMSQVNVKEQDLLPLIDVEVIPRGMSGERMRIVLNEFLRLVTREFGKKPMIYTGKNFYNKYFAGHGYNKEYKFMIAAYSLEEPILYNNEDFIVWQYTSQGRAKGIKGDVDISRIRGGHNISEIFY